MLKESRPVRQSQRRDAIDEEVAQQLLEVGETVDQNQGEQNESVGEPQ
jgi:hypothetical protein